MGCPFGGKMVAGVSIAAVNEDAHALRKQAGLLYWKEGAEEMNESNVLEPAQGNSTERLWDVKQCASFLNMSTRWLRNALMIEDTMPGSIPHTRLGSRARFDPETIREWVKANTPPASNFRDWQRRKKS